MKTIKTIVLAEIRSYSWTAYFEDEPSRRVTGQQTRIEAIGRLIENHSDYAGLLIRVASEADRDLISGVTAENQRLRQENERLQDENGGLLQQLADLEEQLERASQPQETPHA